MASNSTLSIVGASLGAAAVVLGFNYLRERAAKAKIPSKEEIDAIVAAKVKEALAANAALFRAPPTTVKAYPPVGRPEKQVGRV